MVHVVLHGVAEAVSVVLPLELRTNNSHLLRHRCSANLLPLQSTISRVSRALALLAVVDVASGASEASEALAAADVAVRAPVGRVSERTCLLMQTPRLALRSLSEWKAALAPLAATTS